MTAYIINFKLAITERHMDNWIYTNIYIYIYIYIYNYTDKSEHIKNILVHSLSSLKVSYAPSIHFNDFGEANDNDTNKEVYFNTSAINKEKWMLSSFFWLN